MMEEAKFNQLCSHYKDTFDIHRASIKQRDTLFYALLLTLAVFTLQFSSVEVVTSIVTEYVQKSTGVKLGQNTDFMSTLLWFVILGFSTRYFQVVLEIERQYGYLHKLEATLNNQYDDEYSFTREGKSYLSKYPLFSNWVWLLYTLFFPSILLFVIIARIKFQVSTMESIEINQIIDFICYLIVGTSTVLYTYRLHEEAVLKSTGAVWDKIKSIKYVRSGA
ncbi:hypothetical protein QU232_004244 [Vibrio vulnificus]|uniref:hypothetical protein n=1 Tax=Vibrio cholerae TaxID=666 RepID=UPI00292A9D36|nr:hypothetical protein [Vibrio vulnificus]ELP1870024.1 hypothetical protein [Vibrio vulnificus]EME0911870.1 hypothetical protein [Vibrio vulnificus]